MTSDYSNTDIKLSDIETFNILIGRSVPQNNINEVIPQSEKIVSNHHARLTFDGKKLTIEDVGSSNGTYVNGIRIASKNIKVKDCVTLGGPNGYKLDVEAIVARHRIGRSDGFSDGGYDDFSLSVSGLERIYDEYNEKMALLQKRQGRIMLVRMLPTMVIGSLMGVVTAIVNESLKMPVLVGGGIITVIVFLVAASIANEMTVSLTKARQELNDNFDLKFLCPACKSSWRGHSFSYYRQRGACPMCKKTFKV